MTTELRAALRDWIAERCVLTAGREPLVNSRGERQAWMIDLRPALLDGWAANAIAELLWREMEPAWPFQFAAQELAGVPLMSTLLAVGVARGRRTSGVIIRKERKQHGRQRTIEGELSDLPVVLVDDLVNSGGSVVRALAVLSELERPAGRVFTVIDYGAQSARARLAAAGTTGAALFGLHDFGLSLDKPAASAPAPPPLTIRWSFPPKRATYGFVARKSAPVVHAGQVFHATEAGWLHALDLDTGALRWERRLAQRSKGLWSTPWVRDDALFIGSYDGMVFRLDPATGEEVWRFEGADWVGSSPTVSGDGSHVFIGLEYALGGGTGAVAALDAASGALVWRAPVPAVVHAGPALMPNGDVVCGANDGHLRRLSKTDGARLWSVNLGGEVRSRVEVGRRGERVFAGSADGAVYAVDAADGRVAWRAETEGEIYAPPLLTDGFVYAASTDGAVYKLGAAQGRRLARRDLGGKLFAAPVRDGDSLLIGSTNGRLARLDPQDLRILALHEFDERITSEVAPSPRGPLVSTFDGQLFAIDGRTSHAQRLYLHEADS